MRWILRTLAYLLGGFLVLSLALVLLFKFVPVPITATMIADDNGVTKDWTALANIDRDMVRAVIAAEDGKFCTHEGFDREAIENAMRRNVAVYSGGRGIIRGGSTISQQTAKNVFLWQGGGYLRKGLEAWFTFLIEQFWGKRRIMEVYLNVAETGIGTYGVEAGARRYFNVSAGSLSRMQAARMAAALPLPKERSVKNPRGWLARHGNAISRRIGVVGRDGLDACVYR